MENKSEYIIARSKDFPAEIKGDYFDPENMVKVIQFLENSLNAEFVQAFPTIGYCILRKRTEFITERAPGNIVQHEVRNHA